MGRTAAGVSAMRLRGGDEICGMDIVNPDDFLLVVTEKGYAKRTLLNEYKLQKRNGGGVRTLSKDMARSGSIVSARVVSVEGDITLISREGIMLRTPIKDISKQGRSTLGVKVMNVKNNDVVASVAVLDPKAQNIVDEEKEEEQQDPA